MGRLPGSTNQNKKIVNKDIELPKFICYTCGEVSKSERFSPVLKTGLFKGMRNHAPICRKCLQDLYLHLLHDVYDDDVYATVKRICSMYNIYFNEEIFESLSNSKKDNIMNDYIKSLNLKQYEKHRGKTYDVTVVEEKDLQKIRNQINNNEKIITEKTKEFFGYGLLDEDYLYLQDEYTDWTSRCECVTKSQEVIFKQICFCELDLLKAHRKGLDTKDLNRALLNLLDSANIQPKQIATNNAMDNEIIGMRIANWEKSKPLPDLIDIDEELKDVDYVGRYIDVFFKGHLAKSIGIKNVFSNLYEKFMKKYTVNKPEYEDDDINDTVFDSIFDDNGDE